MASHKKGWITASTVSPFLTGKGSDLLKGGENAAKVIALERLELEGLVEMEEGFTGNSATEWGIANEPDAVKRYSEAKFAPVHSEQVGIEFGEWLSCTPDGLVGDAGLVEVKCPEKTKNHMERLLSTDEFVKEYEDQVKFQIMASGRDWCDLVSYDPRFSEPLDIVTVRVHRDPAWEKRTLERIRQAEVIIDDTITKIKARIS